jgi:hypothetical protein
VLACNQAPTTDTAGTVPTAAPDTSEAAALAELPTDTPASAAETQGNPAADKPVPTDTPVVAPTDTPLPAPTAPPAPTPEPLFYNLPPATLTNATGLYASPNRAELIVPVPVPAGETVFVMGRNATRTHLRVVWNTGVGWVPVSFTSYNGQRDRMEALPVFEREPPACAVPLTTQFGLNSTWTSDIQQRIAVIADLFRSRYGDFPASYLALVVNGVVVESSRRSIVEQGQFSLKDVVFSIPQDLQPGDTVAYQLETASDEPLTFMATIFSVPSNCKWKLD